MKDIKGQVVVITGASSGIGLATAKQFAEKGAKVYMLARGKERLESACDALRNEGLDVVSRVVDVADEESVKRCFADIFSKESKIDFLINNAGSGFATKIAETSMEDWNRIMQTNLTGVFLCCRETLAGGMAEQKSGHIINVSSIVGKVANPNAPIYCGSKHGLNGLTDGLRQQVAPQGIKVSLVSPSAVDTAYWDGRDVDRSQFLSTDEVADAILYVAMQPTGVLIKDIDLSAFRS